MDDAKLLEQIKRRNQDAMVALHARYADLIYSISYRVLNDNGTAEECVQDTFMRVWQNTAQFDPARGSLVAWLIGIARNVAIDKLRQRGRQVNLADDRESLDETDNIAASAMPDDWRDRERLQGLKFAMQALPPEQYEVLNLSYYGGMSQSEIAEHLKLPLGTVKTRMRLGMQKLRDAWQENN
ncbi:MAG: sigma-70 family RNA polymerase sigma factor [Anaerolineae bacterium]|nr:sigma-70 family RNA polymerase sigma factor [Anaerolineae bacterium]